MGRARENARERVLSSMIEVAASLGYPYASVGEVIAQARASRTTFYEHFTDREHCFLAALEHAGDTLAGEVAAATGVQLAAGRPAAPGRPRRSRKRRLSETAPPEPARAALDAIIAFAEREQAAAHVILLDSLAAGPDGLALRDRLIETLAGIIEAAWASRPSDLEALDVPALGLIGGIFRLLSMRLDAGAAALHGLHGDLSAWLDSYAVPSGPFHWREGTALGTITTRPAQPAPQAPVLQTLPRGRHGLPAAQVARSHRERIMAGLAYEAFEHGYSEVTVTGIVAAAQVSRNVFYEQFSDKRAAAIASLQDGFERAMGATAQSFFASDGWPERIWAIGERLTEHYLAHPADAYLSFVELHAIGPDAVRLAHERLRVFTLLLEEGYTLREGEPLPRLVSEALVATILELGYRQAPRKGRSTRPVLLGQQAYMCLAPFIGPAAASELVAERMGAASTA